MAHGICILPSQRLLWLFNPLFPIKDESRRPLGGSARTKRVHFGAEYKEDGVVYESGERSFCEN
jgi:hypothetical protein